MVTTENIKDILASLNEDIDSHDLDDYGKLSEQGIESLDTFDLFLRVEEDYGVTISDEEIEELNTIQMIVDHINNNLNS